jgi:hypothetical protein
VKTLNPKRSLYVGSLQETSSIMGNITPLHLTMTHPLMIEGARQSEKACSILRRPSNCNASGLKRGIARGQMHVLAQQLAERGINVLNTAVCVLVLSTRGTGIEAR